MRAFDLAQNFEVESLIVGDFVPDRAFRQEIAALDADGTVHVFARGELDTRPFTQREQLARQARAALARKMPVSDKILARLSKSDLAGEPAPAIETDDKTWAQYDEFFAAAPNALASAKAVLTSGRLSNYGEDLIVLDAARSEVLVMPLVFDAETSEKVSYAGRRETVRFSVGGAPVAAFAARLNFDGDRDLLVLQDGEIEPSALLTAPEAGFTVNSSGDQPDANPGNGVCATAGAVCTLRAAVMEANHLPGNDSIAIGAGLNITLSNGRPDNDAIGENSAASGDLDIFCAVNPSEDSCNLPLSSNNNDLSITGAAGGNTISAGAFAASSGTGVTTDRVFDIGMDGVFGGGFGAGTGIDVTMSNLTIQNANVREDLNAGLGAGNYARGAAIRIDGFGQSGARGSLALTNVVIANNQADHDTGGIFNQYASVSLSAVTATGNIGKGGPGGALQFLAGAPATLSVANSTFTANEARSGTVFGTPATDADGGAIAANNDTNTATINTTNFTGNVAYDDGGAFKAFNGAMTVTGGAMTGNAARDDGGAVWGDVDTVGAARFLTLSGVTIRDNRADSDNSGAGDGGAIFRDRGTLNVTNCTIGGTAAGQPNSAVNGGAVAHAFRAGAHASNVTAINVDNGSISGNNASASGGAVYFNAANAASPSVLSVGATTLVAVTENNANVHGGGFALFGNATVNLTRASIHGNDADKDGNANGDGGGVYHNGAGTTTIAATVALGTGGQGNTAENGAALHHSSGTLTLNSPSIAANAADQHGGGLFVSGGTVNVNAVAFAANTAASGTEVRLTNGTTNFSGNVTIPGELSLTGGTLAAGASTVNLGEDFHFSSGTFTANTSTFVFNGAAAQQIYGGAAPVFNNVTVSNTASPLAVNNNMSANGILLVNAGAIVNPSSATVVGGAGTLTGSGSVRVTRTAATADFATQYSIANKTLTNLTVDYAGASVQTVTALAYGNLRLNNASGANLAAGTTTVNNALTLQNGALGVGTSTLVVNGAATQTSGTVTSAAAGTVNYNQSSNGQAVLAGGYGNLTFSNFNKTLPNGTVSIAGAFNTGSAAGHATAGSTISFSGAGAQTIPAFAYNNLSTAGAGVKTLGANVNVGGDLTIGASTTLLIPATRTLTVLGAITNNGTIQGTGTLAGDLANSGTLAPGLSPGIFNVDGDFANTGTLSVEIGGTGGAGVNPNGHDQVLVSGAATLGGTLTLTQTNGYSPQPGDSFVILDAASSSGAFATTNLPDILPNRWVVQYDNAAGTVTLVVVSPTASSSSISGRVLTADGRAVKGALVTVIDESGAQRTARANSFGSYRIDALASGRTYTVAAAAKGHRFNSRVISLSDDAAGFDLVAEAAAR